VKYFIYQVRSELGLLFGRLESVFTVYHFQDLFRALHALGENAIACSVHLDEDFSVNFLDGTDFIQVSVVHPKGLVLAALVVADAVTSLDKGLNLRVRYESNGVRILLERVVEGHCSQPHRQLVAINLAELLTFHG